MYEERGNQRYINCTYIRTLRLLGHNMARMQYGEKQSY